MSRTIITSNFIEKDIELAKFFDISNELTDMINRKTCKTDLSKVFLKLLFTAEDYFLNLEILLNKHSYPKLAKQKNFHQVFFNNVKAIQKEYTEGNENCCVKINTFLKDWLNEYNSFYKKDCITFIKNKELVT